MARTLKESFGNIGRVMADEYKEHGRARGISIELVNGVFDFGDKVSHAFRTYAPQAADTAREQGTKVAAAAKEQGTKVAEAAKEQGTKVAEAAKEYGSKMAETAKSRCHDDDSTPHADDDSTPADDDSAVGHTSGPTEDGEESGEDAQEPDAETDATDAGTVEGDGEEGRLNAQPSISPEDAEEANRVIDGKIDDFIARQKDIQSEIDALTKSGGRITKETQGKVDNLSEEYAKLDDNINYLRDSKKSLEKASGNQEGE